MVGEDDVKFNVNVWRKPSYPSFKNADFDRFLFTYLDSKSWSKKSRLLKDYTEAHMLQNLSQMTVCRINLDLDWNKFATKYFMWNLYHRNCVKLFPYLMLHKYWWWTHYSTWKVCRQITFLRNVIEHATRVLSGIAELLAVFIFNEVITIVFRFSSVFVTGTKLVMHCVQRFYQWTPVNDWGAVLPASCWNRRVCLHFLGSLQKRYLLCCIFTHIISGSKFFSLI